MKIHEVMKRTGLSRKAIYVYEDQGLLTPAKGAQGYRDYSEEDTERLLLIAKLRELDIPLEDIALLFAEPGKTDILLQNHFQKMQNGLQVMLQKLSRLQTILYNLPPNGDLEDFINAAKIAIPEETAIAAAQYLAEDPALSSARRITMHMNEAFLDVPLDTPERWDAWYHLLDEMDRTSTQVWDGYETYYGNMTTEQKYEDYRLRRALVVGYTKYTPQDERRKAEEILASLKRLLSDSAYAERWRQYYRLVVSPSLNPGSLINCEEWLAVLSDVYIPYNRRFRKIMDTWISPYLETEEGVELSAGLKQVLRDAYDLSPLAIIFFDFWNNTLEKLAEGR